MSDDDVFMEYRRRDSFDPHADPDPPQPAPTGVFTPLSNEGVNDTDMRFDHTPGPIVRHIMAYMDGRLSRGDICSLTADSTSGTRLEMAARKVRSCAALAQTLFDEKWLLRHYAKIHTTYDTRDLLAAWRYSVDGAFVNNYMAGGRALQPWGAYKVTQGEKRGSVTAAVTDAFEASGFPLEDAGLEAERLWRLIDSVDPHPRGPIVFRGVKVPELSLMKKDRVKQCLLSSNAFTSTSALASVAAVYADCTQSYRVAKPRCSVLVLEHAGGCAFPLLQTRASDVIPHAEVLYPPNTVVELDLQHTYTYDNFDPWEKKPPTSVNFVKGRIYSSSACPEYRDVLNKYAAGYEYTLSDFKASHAVVLQENTWVPGLSSRPWSDRMSANDDVLADAVASTECSVS